MTDPSSLELAGLVVAALLVGVAKTALGGLGLVSVAIFAAVLPARGSTGVLLPLLLVGDVLAVRVYRRHADWSALVRLLPSVVPGVLLGVVFLGLADDTAVRRTIGVILLVLVLVHLLQSRRSASPAVAHDRPGKQAGADRTTRRGAVSMFGGLAGFTTMVANAGGPVMALYLLASRLDKLSFLGTSAWFFLVVNAAKLPFSIALGLIDVPGLLLDAALVPAVLAGAGLGLVLVRRISQDRFEQLVVLLTVLAAGNLLR
jgi:uncharacterized membrane protein YfcA